jgi:hypothetical protein
MALRAVARLLVMVGMAAWAVVLVLADTVEMAALEEMEEKAE